MAVPKKVLVGIEESFRHHTAGKAGGKSFLVTPRPDQDLARPVKHLRERLSMTQLEFALQFEIPIRTLQNWEQAERCPEGPARAYLAVIAQMPDAVLAALRAAREGAVVEA